MRPDVRANKKRLGVAFFYDAEGIVDDYFTFLLNQLSPFFEKTICVVNGFVTQHSLLKLEECCSQVIVRENSGLDVGAYYEALKNVGFNSIKQYDEIIFFNHTFYGPLTSFFPMFEKMSSSECDFWGITAHNEIVPNPFDGSEKLAYHLNSHFIAVRNRMISSHYFKEYWEGLPNIRSYNDSVLYHESIFTEHFVSLGFCVDCYVDNSLYASTYPLFEEVDQVIADGCPIIKRRSFFTDPIMADQKAIDLPRAVSNIQSMTEYNMDLIWKNITRSSEPRVLHTNSALMNIISDSEVYPVSTMRVAIFVHIYYIDTINEINDYLKKIPCPFDLFVTTDTQDKKIYIEDQLRESRAYRDLNILVVRNVGADTSALLVGMRDVVLSDRYDIICRLHGKKSPQDGGGVSRFFKRHLFENLVNSPGYVQGILNLFENEPRLGMAFPPAIHVHYSTMGHGWFTNHPRTSAVATMLGLRVNFDKATPVAPYGGMFWFRPDALRKLFEYEWTWENFATDTSYADGDLPHAIERIYAYVAQDSGYYTRSVMSIQQAVNNYTRLEYKVHHLSSLLPAGDFGYCSYMVNSWKEAKYPLVNVDDLYTLGSKIESSRTGVTYSGGLVDVDPWKVHWWRYTGVSDGIDILSDKKMSSEFGTTWQVLKHSRRRSRKWPLSANVISFGLRRDSLDKKQQYKIVHDFISLLPDDVKPRYFSDGSRVSTINTYLEFGASAGFELVPLFDSNYYLNSNPDLVDIDVSPFVHYLVEGWRQSLSPHPLFDGKRYLSLYRDVADSGINPLLHFLRHGGLEYREPHVLFDTLRYVNRYPEVRLMKKIPLLHYLSHGSRMGYSPNALFDQDYYLAFRMKHDIPVMSAALSDFVANGDRLGIDPHPLFDRRYLSEKAGKVVTLEDFTADRGLQRHSPHPFFANEFYLSNLESDKIKGGIPIVNFLDNFEVGSCPHPLFDCEFYLKMYPDVARRGMNPLIHFVRFGLIENRNPNAEFDCEDYAKYFGSLFSNGELPFMHFFRSRNGEILT